MGSRLTALVVGAVLLLVVVGVVDALRDGESETAQRRSPPGTTTNRPELPETPAQRLRARGFAGLLFVAVREGAGCGVDVVALPTLSRSRLLDGVACRIRVSPTGLVAAGQPCGAQGEASFPAQTRVGVRELRGCAPAWRPNGRLTFVNRRGDVVELVEPCASARPCLRVVVDRRETPFPILDVAWFGPDRFAALLEDRRGNASVAVFGAGRLLAVARLDRPLRRYVRLVAGRVVVPAGDPSGEILAFDDSARLVSRQAAPGSIADGEALTYSTDGMWVASSAGGRVAVYRPSALGPREAVFLDLNVEDLGAFGS